MVMKRLVYCLLAALSLLSSTGQNAAAAGNDWMKKKDAPKSGSVELSQYAVMRAGGYFPEISVNGRGKKFDIGTGFEAGYGIRALRFLAVEGAFGYFDSDYLSDHPDYFNDPVYLLSAVPMTLTLKAIAPFEGIELYALGGAGMNYLMLKKQTSPNAGNTVVNEHRSDDFTKSFHYGGGIGLNLGKSSSLSIEVRRIEALSSTMLGDTFDISGTFLYGSVTLGF
jgi:hypothetical protein